MQFKMADYEKVLTRVCKEKLGGKMLKPEKKEAIESLLNGEDVFVVLPTGFGESLIYQSYVFGKEMRHSRSASGRRMSYILTHVRVALATTGLERLNTRN